jgi:hypothetical protein
MLRSCCPLYEEHYRRMTPARWRHTKPCSESSHATTTCTGSGPSADSGQPCGFVMAMAAQQQGEPVEAFRYFERNRAACGPAGIFSEEYDVRQRQMRGSLPQAFMHAGDVRGVKQAGAHPNESADRRECVVTESPSAQTVVITGAGAGIGRAVARDFGRTGARIGLLPAARLASMPPAAKVEKTGGRALAIPTDVSNYDEIDEGAKKVEHQLGDIDVWINVAFSTVFAPSHQIAPEEYRPVTHVTYLFRVRHHGGAASHATSRPRHDRAGGFGAGTPADSAAIGVLRRKTRAQRASPDRCEQSYCMRAATCTSRSCSCPH